MKNTPIIYINYKLYIYIYIYIYLYNLMKIHLIISMYFDMLLIVVYVPTCYRIR